MKYLQYLIILYMFQAVLSAQPNMEISLPLGVSNYVNTEVGDDFDYIQSPVHSSPQFGWGLDFDLCPWSLKNIEFFVGFSYRSLSFQVEQELHRESFTWTYRDILIGSKDRFFGFNLSPRYNFWVGDKHSLGIQGQYGYLLTLRNITTIDMEQVSFFQESTEQFNYLISTFPGIQPATNYSGSLIYVFGANNFRLKLEAGYEYLDRNADRPLSNSSKDWQFFYTSVGFKFFP